MLVTKKISPTEYRLGFTINNFLKLTLSNYNYLLNFHLYLYQLSFFFFRKYGLYYHPYKFLLLDTKEIIYLTFILFNKFQKKMYKTVQKININKKQTPVFKNFIPKIQKKELISTLIFFKTLKKKINYVIKKNNSTPLINYLLPYSVMLQKSLKIPCSFFFYKNFFYFEKAIKLNTRIKKKNKKFFKRYLYFLQKSKKNNFFFNRLNFNKYLFFKNLKLKKFQKRLLNMKYLINKLLMYYFSTTINISSKKMINLVKKRFLHKLLLQTFNKKKKFQKFFFSFLLKKIQFLKISYIKKSVVLKKHKKISVFKTKEFGFENNTKSENDNVDIKKRKKIFLPQLKDRYIKKLYFKNLFFILKNKLKKKKFFKIKKVKRFKKWYARKIFRKKKKNLINRLWVSARLKQKSYYLKKRKQEKKFLKLSKAFFVLNNEIKKIKIKKKLFREVLKFSKKNKLLKTNIIKKSISLFSQSKLHKKIKKNKIKNNRYKKILKLLKKEILEKKEIRSNNFLTQKLLNKFNYTFKLLTENFLKEKKIQIYLTHLNDILKKNKNIKTEFLVLYKRSQALKTMKKNKLRFFNFFYLSLYYKNFFLLLSYYKYFLLKQTRHVKFIYNIINLYRAIYYYKQTQIHGIKILMHGTYDRHGRTRKFIYLIGKFKISSINLPILFDWVDLASKYGAISLKIWIIYKSFFFTKKMIEK